MWSPMGNTHLGKDLFNSEITSLQATRHHQWLTL
jgi:hypothetical protein